jgi:hypothetical protein
MRDSESGAVGRERGINEIAQHYRVEWDPGSSAIMEGSPGKPIEQRVGPQSLELVLRTTVLLMSVRLVVKEARPRSK